MSLQDLILFPIFVQMNCFQLKIKYMNKQFTLIFIITGILSLIVTNSCQPKKQVEEEVDSEWVDSLQHVYEYGVCIDSMDVNRYEIRQGDNPAIIFSRLGFSALKADSITRASAHVLDPTKLKAGMHFCTDRKSVV